MHPSFEAYLRETLEDNAHPSSMSIEERRERMRAEIAAVEGSPEPMADVRAMVIALAGRDLNARLYVPLDEAHEAVVVYFHGGSFVAGDLDTHDHVLRRLSADTKMRFVAIDYRLAPEHPFPAAIHDAVDTLRYVAEHEELFDVAGAKLIVMGDSAGGALAAVAAALTRDEPLGIVGQVLVYPTMGPEVVTNSSHQYGQGYGLDMDHLRYDYGRYLGDFTDHTDPRVTPLMFEDLTGAPDAIIVVAECDPLRDEAVAYAGLLEHFGVHVELLEAEGMLHGFLHFGESIPDALSIVDDLAHHMGEYVTRG